MRNEICRAGKRSITQGQFLFTIALALTSSCSFIEDTVRAEEIQKGASKLLQAQRPALINRIVKEQEHASFGPLVSSYRSLPTKGGLYETTVEGHPCKLAIQQLGTGTHEEVLVMIHGVLSDHLTWRYVAGPLSRDFDLWLVDLPGCGESEAPDPNSLGPRGYGPTAMAERVLQALDQCLNEQSRQVQLRIIGHSLGGMVSAQMLGNPDLKQRYESVLRHIQGMVLFAPAEFAFNQENPVFAKIVKLPGYQVSIAKGLKILDCAAAQADLDGVCSSNRLARETAQNLAHVLGTASHRHAAQAMLRQAVCWNEKTHRPAWALNKALEAHYANINIPCLIVWGEQDETLPAAMGHKIKDLIPGARLIELPECMHSPHMECPDQSVEIIREFCGQPSRRNIQARVWDGRKGD